MAVRKKAFSSLAILFMLALSFHVNAQLYIGVEAGGTQNYLMTNVSSLNATEIVPKNGLAISAVIEYKVKDWFSLEATPGFIQKNYQMQRTGYYNGIYEKTTNDYLQLPLAAKFYFGSKKLKGFMTLGGYAAYWTSSHIKGAMPNILNQTAYNPYAYESSDPVVFSQTVFDDYIPYYYDRKYQFDKIKDRRLEFGVSPGLGINYEPSSNISFFAEFKYYDALTDQQKNYQYGQDARYNETGTVLIGFTHKVHFHCKKKAPKAKTTTTNN